MKTIKLSSGTTLVCAHIVGWTEVRKVEANWFEYTVHTSKREFILGSKITKELKQDIEKLESM